MDSITINGKDYKIKKYTFASMCQLERLGFDYSDGNMFTKLRAVLAYTMDKPLAKTEEEIDKYIENGGKLETLIGVLETLTESDFFKSLQ